MAPSERGDKTHQPFVCKQLSYPPDIYLHYPVCLPPQFAQNNLSLTNHCSLISSNSVTPLHEWGRELP